MKTEIYVEEDFFVKLKKMSKCDLNKFLMHRLETVEKQLAEKKMEDLKRKIKEFEERRDTIEKEIIFLTQLNSKAKREQKIMEQWIFKLRKENSEMAKKMGAHK